MKILVISEGKHSTSAIDLWRIWRPMQELAKYVDWQIDYQDRVIRGQDEITDSETFIKEHGEAEVDHLGQYDIIFTTYFTSPYIAAVLYGAKVKYGTKTIIDFDDDVYDIDPINPFWLKAGQDAAYYLQRLAATTSYISTTTPYLATKLKNKSESKAMVYTLPNVIGHDYEQYNPDNGNKVVVGYFGGSSHYDGLHDTGVLPAIRKIMNERKDVCFKCVGLPIDEYLPKARTTILDPVASEKWTGDMFPKLNFDIAIAPLKDTQFNRSKSDIKWQESTRMGAAFVASAVEPYKRLPGGAAVVTNNTQSDWYEAITKLLDKPTRNMQVDNARVALKQRIDSENWKHYKTMFEEVASENN